MSTNSTTDKAYKNHIKYLLTRIKYAEILNRERGIMLMKLIAHRGASLEFAENTVEGLIFAARLNAYAVECDIRSTKDNKFVIFHDNNLKRMAGIDVKVEDISFAQMNEALNESGHKLLTFENLVKEYKEETPILLHIKLPFLDEATLKIFKNTKIDFIMGIAKPQDAKLCSDYYSMDRILAFMPNPYVYEEFIENRAGIIRLWENWLNDVKPQDIKSKHDVEVFIMSRDENGSMNGKEESLTYFQSLLADGVLLNDISLGIRWKNKTLNT